MTKHFLERLDPSRFHLTAVVRISLSTTAHTYKAQDAAHFGKRTVLQERSGVARVVKGSHSFTCTPTRLSIKTINRAHTQTCPVETSVGTIR